GIAITHVDTHKHTHLFPRVGRPLLNVLERAGIPAIRNPFEPEFSQRLAHAGLKRRLQIRILNQFRAAFERHTPIHSRNIATTQGTLGVSATGNLNRATLTEIMNTIPPEGSFELVCHPGYNDADLARVATRLRNHREIEMEALLTVIPAVLAKPNSPQLIHYGKLAATDRTLSS
ncbi:MAG TPA: ChbG/HpnK family deacetylase, partial [Edaphobacter sp.]|nr:ChbG/HpnK family deacetylase [Edaphobacter sp.]